MPMLNELMQYVRGIILEELFRENNGVSWKLNCWDFPALSGHQARVSWGAG